MQVPRMAHKVKELKAERDGKWYQIIVYEAYQSSGYQTKFEAVPNWYVTIRPFDGFKTDVNRTRSKKTLTGWLKQLEAVGAVQV